MVIRNAHSKKISSMEKVTFIFLLYFMTYLSERERLLIYG
jgi:hypothetical protein